MMSAGGLARAGSSTRRISSSPLRPGSPIVQRTGSRTVGRQVKCLEDRREHLIATNHAREAVCELEIACAGDGTIIGLRGAAVVDMGAYIRTNGPTSARNIAQVLSGPYRVPHIHIDVSL